MSRTGALRPFALASLTKERTIGRSTFCSSATYTQEGCRSSRSRISTRKSTFRPTKEIGTHHIGLLDGGSVCDGVREGHAELDNVGAAGLHCEHDIDRHVGSREACSDERHKDGHALCVCEIASGGHRVSFLLFLVLSRA